MKVKDIMTSGALKHCSPETSLQEAAKTMKAGNCGALPVIDETQRVVGIVTDRDIALSLARKQSKPANETSVKEIMSSRVFTIEENDNLEAALGKMRINKVGRLPVVNKQQQLQGIVSIHNLLSGRNEKLSEDNSRGESLTKTIIALSDRYAHSTAVKHTNSKD